MFLEISQNSQENTCARVSFLIKLQAWDPGHPWTTASRLTKKESQTPSQLTSTCSKPITETLEKGVEYIQR